MLNQGVLYFGMAVVIASPQADGAKGATAQAALDALEWELTALRAAGLLHSV